MPKAYLLGTNIILEEDATYFYIKDGSTVLFQATKSTGVQPVVQGVAGDFSGQVNGDLAQFGRVVMLGTTGYVKFHTLTSTQRDALTPEQGMVIFNTTATKLQVYNGLAWADLH